MEEIDKEISEMKLCVNSRARICAEEFLKRVSLEDFISIDYIISNKTVYMLRILVLLTVISSTLRITITVWIYIYVVLFIVLRRRY